WLGMLHIDPWWEPAFESTAFYRLRAEDVQYLRDCKVDPEVVASLETLKDQPYSRRQEFLDAVRGKLRPGDSKDLAVKLGRTSWPEAGYEYEFQLAQMARDATLIRFSPFWLLVKFSAALVVCLALVCVAAWRVDVNLNSLHALYGNRLVRAYLGASRPNSDTDP